VLERLSEPDRFLCFFLSDDRFGFPTAYMHISHDVSLLDEDAEHFGEQPLPIHSFEMVAEAIYEAHVSGCSQIPGCGGCGRAGVIALVLSVIGAYGLGDLLALGRFIGDRMRLCL
jgi:hypothetical protein